MSFFSIPHEDEEAPPHSRRWFVAKNSVVRLVPPLPFGEVPLRRLHDQQRRTQGLQESCWTKCYASATCGILAFEPPALTVSYENLLSLIFLLVWRVKAVTIQGFEAWLVLVVAPFARADKKPRPPVLHEENMCRSTLQYPMTARPPSSLSPPVRHAYSWRAIPAMSDDGASGGAFPANPVCKAASPSAGFPSGLSPLSPPVGSPSPSSATTAAPAPFMLISGERSLLRTT